MDEFNPFKQRMEPHRSPMQRYHKAFDLHNVADTMLSTDQIARKRQQASHVLITAFVASLSGGALRH